MILKRNVEHWINGVMRDGIKYSCLISIGKKIPKEYNGKPIKFLGKFDNSKDRLYSFR